MDDPKLWAEVSSEAKDLIRKLLDKDPKSRPSSADILRHPWFQDTDKKYEMDNHVTLTPESTNEDDDTELYLQ